jgi:hypothetical protein
MVAERGHLGQAACPKRLSLSSGNVTRARPNDEMSFMIERSTNGSQFSRLARVATNTTSYKAAALLPSTEYYCRVKARNSVGDSAYSKVASASSR